MVGTVATTVETIWLPSFFRTIQLSVGVHRWEPSSGEVFAVADFCLFVLRMLGKLHPEFSGILLLGPVSLISSSIICKVLSSVQFSSVAQSCPTLCDPMNRSTPGLSVHHHLPESTQTHVHRVHDDIQPSHPRSSPSPPAPNPSQHQSLFQ